MTWGLLVALTLLGLAANVVILSWRVGRMEARLRHLEAVLGSWEFER